MSRLHLALDKQLQYIGKAIQAIHLACLTRLPITLLRFCTGFLLQTRSNFCTAGHFSSADHASASGLGVVNWGPGHQALRGVQALITGDAVETLGLGVLGQGTRLDLLTSARFTS
jgi:hypothetical protein